MWNVVDATTRVGITSDGPPSGQNLLFGITAFVMLLSFCLQLITGLVRSHPPALSHEDEQSKCTGVVREVGLGERCGNRRRVVERLVVAWNRGVGGVSTPVDAVARAVSEVVTEPRRRARTPLTEEEVDAIRTARVKGVSLSSIAQQFAVHRGTVWEKTHY